MSHNIEYFEYGIEKPMKEIIAELDAYVHHRTYAEGGSGVGHIRVYEGQVHKSHADAMEWIRAHDDGNYNQMAVVYRRLPEGVTSKALEAIKEKIKVANAQYSTEWAKVPHKNIKAEFIACKGCGSKLKRALLTGNYCPVCRADLRSATQLDKIQRLRKKVEELEQKHEAEEQKLMDKKAVLMRLVKIEYHT